MQQKKIAIFASGNGSNAEKIFDYFKNHPKGKVSLLLTNNPNAPVRDRAKKFGISEVVFNRATFYETGQIPTLLKDNEIDLVVLAGFMWLVPENLVKAFPKKIVNIHPALLPKYGGKGMYGSFVHTAVVEAREKESGITIHYVNENYDEGDVIFQEKCKIDPSDTPVDLAEKIHILEHKHYPKVIEKLLHS